MKHELGAGTGVAGGAEVHRSEAASGGRERQEVVVRFRRPVMGRTLVGLRLELGRGPLDKSQVVEAMSVRGAKNERGYVVITAENGVQVETPAVENLREVHTGSVPLKVADAQYAFRFRDSDWTLGLMAHKKNASTRVEAFHLVSIGEGVAHGMVAVSYFIVGSPVDELHVTVPAEFQNVEFVTRDLRRATRDAKNPERWTLKLQRKILGDYNLGITYTQRYQDGGELGLGGVECTDVTTQTGYLVVASHIDLMLASPEVAGIPAVGKDREEASRSGSLGGGDVVGGGGRGDANLLDIDPQELPANYRLLVNAPILKAFKYVNAPHQMAMRVRAYDRGTLPPVIIEMVELQTTVGVKDAQAAESATTVRYKIKNSTGQFLMLDMPKGATAWAVRMIEVQDGKEKAERLTISVDQATGRLLIPLPRKRNPNEPTTIELEYGQVHDATGGGAEIRLAGPTSPQRATFCSWVVQAPAEWALLPVPGGGGGMTPEVRAERQGDLGAAVAPVGQAWGWALGHWNEPGVLATGIGALAMLVVVMAMRRGAVPGAVVFVVLAGLVVFGVMAACAPGFLQGLGARDDLSVVRYTHTVALDQEQPLTVDARLVPAWRQAAGDGPLWVWPVVAGVALVLAVGLRRRLFLRAMAAAVMVAALLMVAPKFPATTVALGHALTWGVPVVLMVWFLGSAVGWWRGRAGAAGVVAGGGGGGGSGGSGGSGGPGSENPGDLAGGGGAVVQRSEAASGGTGDAGGSGAGGGGEAGGGAGGTVVPGVPGGGPGAAPVVGAVVVLLLAMVVGMGGCTSAGRVVLLPEADRPVIDRLDCKLTAERDSVAVALHMRVSSAKPGRVMVMREPVLMMGELLDTRTLAFETEGGRHYLRVKEAGVYEVDMSFLAPLPGMNADQERQFHLPLPVAITNRVEMTLPETQLEVEAPTAVRLSKEEVEGGDAKRQVGAGGAGDLGVGDAKRQVVTEGGGGTGVGGGGRTVVRAMFEPGAEVAVAWRPRFRQVTLEETQFYAQVDSMWLFDTGLAEGRHLMLLQVARGELRQVQVVVPENMTVIAVEGAGVGAWRFEPGTHELEVRLTRGVTGEYRLLVVTQIAGVQMPFKAAIVPLRIKGAARQQGRTGLLTRSAVYATVGEHPQAMNAGDFARDAAGLVGMVQGLGGGTQEDAKRQAGAGAGGGAGVEAAKRQVGTGAGGSAAGADAIRQAYRTDGASDKLVVEIAEVQPEIRSGENAVFSVADDRLVYNAQFMIDIAKAGLFSVDLRVPEGFDVDTLGSAEVSHWDEKTGGGGRVVEVHFNKKLLGQTVLNLTLSRPMAELSGKIAVPRVEAVGAIKHTGQLVVNSDRSVRLSVAERSGVSELNPLELEIRTPGALAFRLLGPQWNLVLQTEVIEPRVNVDFLHTARVSEGLVRHADYLRYKLQNAGVKVLEVQLPKGAVDVALSGADIARSEELPAGSGHWRLELGNKWYDRPYALTVRYMTRYDRAAGRVEIGPVKAIGADLQRGYVVVEASERVDVAAAGDAKRQAEAGGEGGAGGVGSGASGGGASGGGGVLQVDEARSVPREFGAGDLSNAALCYRAAGADYLLALTAKRHDAAALLEAEVVQTQIVTVLTEQGQSVNRVAMLLRVGNRRHLEARLPEGAEVWSLTVDGRSIVPTRRKDQKGEAVLLIPLAQVAEGEAPVQVDMVYAVAKSTAPRWAGGESVQGPRFDLPLKDVRWTLCVPEDMKYGDFGGTMVVDKALAESPRYAFYDAGEYEADVQRVNAANTRRAVDLQARANALAAKGQQREAKQAFESACYYSVADPALNEDTRVQLHELSRQQAMVGLLAPRGRLRQLDGQGGEGAGAAVGEAGGRDLGEEFNPADAERVRNSLNKADSENLEGIIERMIEVQEAAEGTPVELVVNMPLRGRVLEFTRGLQVEPNAKMEVTFAAGPGEAGVGRGSAWGVVAVGCAGVMVVLWVGPAVWRRRFKV